MKGKYLITVDNWFVAPDGKYYKAVWGNVEILSDNILGVKTNARSTNWYAKIGSEENHVVIAGCQINYACKSDSKPNTESVEDWSYEKCKSFLTPTKIFIAD